MPASGVERHLLVAAFEERIVGVEVRVDEARNDQLRLRVDHRLPAISSKLARMP